ncbi:tetraspanin-8-like [Mustelus asterias]
MAGVNKCVKYSMFFFNFLFWLCGSIILGISIWLRVSKSAGKIAGVNLGEFYPAINLLITVGSIIMVLGFLGCCGAIKESKCMLILFFIGLLLILVLQITAGILGALYSSEVETVINDTYKSYVPLSGQPPDIIQEIEELQQESCVDVMSDILKASCVIIIGIAFGLAVIEILGLAFSMTLYCQIKNK